MVAQDRARGIHVGARRYAAMRYAEGGANGGDGVRGRGTRVQRAFRPYRNLQRDSCRHPERRCRRAGSCNWHISCCIEIMRIGMMHGSGLFRERRECVPVIEIVAGKSTDDGVRARAAE